MTARASSHLVLALCFVALGLACCAVGCAGAPPVPPPARATAGPPATLPTPMAAAPKPAACGGFEHRQLAPAARAVLGGQLRFRGPLGFDAQQAHSDIVTSPADDHETRLVLSDGAKKLTLHAQQLFRKASADFLTGVQRLAPAGSVVTEHAAEGLTEVRVVPAALRDQGNDAWLLLSVYTRTADALVQQVDFLANKAALGGDTDQGCVAFAKNLAGALSAGVSTVDLTPGTRKLGSHSVALPADTALVTEIGPDFTVYHFYPVLPLNAPGGEALVYIGGFPEPFEQTGTAVRGRAFGAARTWRERIAEKREGETVTRTWTRRTVVALSHDESADLFVEAQDEAVFHALAATLETTK